MERLHLVVDPDDPTTWLMIEKWASRAHWDAHMLTEHNRRFGAIEHELVTTPNTWTFYAPA